MHPLIYGATALLLGAGLAITGIYLLAGLGWSLIAGAIPSLLFGAVVCRGLIRAEAAEDVDEAK